jgi:hypothetical protein
MVNRIVLAAILCVSAASGGLPFAAASADELRIATTPSLELTDQPASDEDLGRNRLGGTVRRRPNAGGLLLPSAARPERRPVSTMPAVP